MNILKHEVYVSYITIKFCLTENILRNHYRGQSEQHEGLEKKALYALY